MEKRKEMRLEQAEWVLNDCIIWVYPFSNEKGLELLEFSIETMLKVVQ